MFFSVRDPRRGVNREWSLRPRAKGGTLWTLTWKPRLSMLVRIHCLDRSFRPGRRATMRRTLFKSKIHRATVTHADLEYEGSVTIDGQLMRAANILPYER